MPDKIVIRDFDTLQNAIGDCSPSRVEFIHGELAFDLITCATAEELLIALRGRLGEANAKTVVGILLDAGLTFDNIIDGEVADAR